MDEEIKKRQIEVRERILSVCVDDDEKRKVLLNFDESMELCPESRMNAKLDTFEKFIEIKERMIVEMEKSKEECRRVEMLLEESKKIRECAQRKIDESRKWEDEFGKRVDEERGKMIEFDRQIEECRKMIKEIKRMRGDHLRVVK